MLVKYIFIISNYVMFLLVCEDFFRIIFNINLSIKVVNIMFDIKFN